MATVRIWFRKLRLTPVHLIVLAYLAFALAGTALLMLPVSLRPGVEISFIDALFTATSAVSVTGLTVVSTPDTFDAFGRAVLLVLIQFGGIGVMTLGTLMFVLMGRRLNLGARMMMKVDQNSPHLQGLVRLMLFILKLALLTELAAAVVMFGYFAVKYQLPAPEALSLSVFHAVSGFTNAGFDLFGDSLRSFRQDIPFQLIIGLLLIAGGIGFPVFLEIIEYVRTRKRLSLFCKLTGLTFAGLIIFGFVLILAGEHNGSLANLSASEKVSVALFQSLTTRSGGFSTFEVAEFRNATLLIMCLLMFIGCSPSSCGGGIRTTTFAVILLSICALFRGRSTVQVLGRELHPEDVQQAYSILVIAGLLVFTGAVILMEIEPFGAIPILFEVCSAFGTTGLSMGITPDLSPVSKVVLIILMFIGRIGILALVLFSQPAHPKKHIIHYPKERLIVGH